ncbi:MAG: hypothetical protein ACP5II_03115 [Infirmifilum sp.]|uniref:Uncharacterized protein n=1 Tax=Infirmifilum uzonense TaxID=1550241 RepID=A0A0F7FHH3_9CREN|nr:hypothetical protein [Infirmifilum uzonense]AKG38745.1 hypothetical protein MA03_04920 [Infirmifilum uzonense]
MKIDNFEDILPIVMPALIASIFTFVPIENFLSAYLVPPSFAWYVPWRGVVVSLILWLISGAIYTEKYYWLKMFFLGSAISFTVFHYWHLFILSHYLSVRLYPLVYFTGASPPIVDLGQVVMILTLFSFKGEISTLGRKIT